MPGPIDERALGNLIRMLNPYSTSMEHPADLPGPATAVGEAPDPKLQFQVEIHDHIANYSSAEWSFRGYPQTIKRALRITYRCPLKDIHDHDTGFYATEHILIGYAGGNGP